MKGKKTVDTSRVIRSAGSVGLFILLSRILGLFRDIGLATVFGTSLSMSAFIVAFTIPNLFRAFFGEGALTSSFVPVFTDVLKAEGKERAWRVAANIFSILSVVLAGIVLAGILLTTFLIHFFPFSEELWLISRLLRIMLPYMFFICSAAFFAAMLNCLGHFALPAAAPMVLNIVLIATILGLCPYLNAEGYTKIMAVSWSVVAAGILQLLMLLPLSFRNGYRFKFSFDLHQPAFRRLCALMPAAIIGSGITRINVLTDRFIALFSGEGGPSYLYFSERLVYLPLGIFAVALSIVLLPTFSAHIVEGRMDELKRTLNQSLRHIIFLTLPAAIGLMVLGKPIIALLYQRGDFTALSTSMTMHALIFYAPGVVIFSLLKVLIPVFYAQKDMKTPVRIGAACTGLNIILSIILLFPLKHAGIALATVIASAVNVFFLSLLIHRRIGSPGWRQIGAASMRMALAVVGMVVSTVTSYNLLQPYCSGLSIPHLIQNGLAVMGAILIAVFVYLLLAVLLRCAELSEIWCAVKKRATS